jgi:hypothetical protein
MSANSTSSLDIDVGVTSGIAKMLFGIRSSRLILSKNTTSQTIFRGRANILDDAFPLIVRVYVDSSNRTKQLVNHKLVLEVGDLVNCRMNVVTIFLGRLATTKKLDSAGSDLAF